jgi:hypothetical protein
MPGECYFNGGLIFVKSQKKEKAEESITSSAFSLNAL